jgi:hypothetical protein
MTRVELCELAQRSTTTDLPTAGRALGIGGNLAYELNTRGEFPVRVLRLGRKYRVPVADLLEYLGVRVAGQ